MRLFLVSLRDELERDLYMFLCYVNTENYIGIKCHL